MVFHPAGLQLFELRGPAIDRRYCFRLLNSQEQNMDSPKVKVNFIDDASGKSIGVADIASSDLPESFELATALHIGDDEWSVVDASPRTRADYAKFGALTLRLHRIQRIDPREILFTLPSICDAIPGVGDQPIDGTELVLAEDDWRQFELVSSALRSEVDEEIFKIRLIHENGTAKVGWREVHVRTKPESPLVCRLTLDNLARCLDVSAQSGLAYRGARWRIPNGYSLTTKDGPSIYGVTANGNVGEIALSQYSSSSPGADSITRLKALAQHLDLDLVHWCRCARAAPDDPLFESLLLK
jgi:hypothetical protein